MRNKDINPIYYENAEEMNKPVNALLQKLRNELVFVRGKMHDIVNSYGWEEHLEYVYGALTCLIIAMGYSVSEIKKYEEGNQDRAE